MRIQWRWEGGRDDGWETLEPHHLEQTLQQHYGGLHEMYPKGTVVEVRCLDDEEPVGIEEASNAN